MFCPRCENDCLFVVDPFVVTVSKCFRWSSDHSILQLYEFLNEQMMIAEPMNQINSDLPKCMNLWMNKWWSLSQWTKSTLTFSSVWIYEWTNGRWANEPNQLWPSQVYESMNEQMIAEPMNQINSDLRKCMNLWMNKWSLSQWTKSTLTFPYSIGMVSTQFGGSLKPASPPTLFFFWGP
jgi:hypothetical protein